jgi:hypothetical protein
VLVAGLFSLDGVPRDALDFERERRAVEVGEGDAGGSEDGEFAVGEEVDVARVMQDAGDVGGEEEFALADAEDGGRAKTRGDEFVGLVGREDTDGKGPGETLDGAADGFFEWDGGLAAGLDSGESEFCGGKVRAVEVVRAASGSFAALRMTDSVEGAFFEAAAARLSSFSMRWAMISVSVSETKRWPLAVSSALRAR